VSRLDRPTSIALALIVLAGGLLRFYGLSWGAPYHHFHIDEHFVFLGAEEMRRDFWAAGEASKFFMYSPLPMYVLIGLVEAFERVVRPLELTNIPDGTAFMVMGRAISAAFGTATIPMVFLIGRRLAGRTAGLLAAGLLAVTVLHVRDSHFLSVDASLTFFCTLTWYCALRMAAGGSLRSYVAAGVAFGAAVLSKYSAAFLAAVLFTAHLVAPRRFAWPGRALDWLRWTTRGAVPGLVGLVTFFALDPLVIAHYTKFRQDVADLITEPLTGLTQPLWGAHFSDIQPQLFWFTNLFWWGLGPALEIWGLCGIVWLAVRARRLPISWVALAFPLAYWAAAGQSTLPFMRYAMPMTPAIAVAAAVLSADLLARAATRRFAVAATSVVVLASALYTLAYMNVFRSPDARLEASAFLTGHLPQDAAILVEPSHNIPPTGRYLTDPEFEADYVLWGPEAERQDRFRLYGLDTYRYLFDTRVSDEDKRAYIARRLAAADYIVMDDTYVQFYSHLPASRHGVVKRYYEQLFAGELGFQLVRTFKVYPSLFGVEINDDGAELSFRLFDHPRIYVFMRTRPGPPRMP
jgi:4-amino-4-deoxy-L-arabinose transferase-like glycosyltransferase